MRYLGRWAAWVAVGAVVILLAPVVSAGPVAEVRAVHVVRAPYNGFVGPLPASFGGVLYAQGCSWYNVSSTPSFLLSSGNGSASVSTTALSCSPNPLGGNYASGNAGFELRFPVNASLGATLRAQFQFRANATWATTPGHCSQTSNLTRGLCIEESGRIFEVVPVLYDDTSATSVATGPAATPYANYTTVQFTCAFGSKCAPTLTGLLNGKFSLGGSLTASVRGVFHKGHSYELDLYVEIGMLAWAYTSNYSVLRGASVTTAQTLSYSLVAVSQS